MSTSDIKISLLLDVITTEINANFDRPFDILIFSNSISSIKKAFPSCSNEEVIEILQLIILAYNSSASEKIELVITAPHNFRLKAQPTSIVIEELIRNAKSSIIITGYSISDYFDDVITEIIRKSKQGVFVKLFVNNYEKQQDGLKELIRNQGRYLKIYDYNNISDKMSALHAKVIVIDSMKSFISSANLSFHGMEGNIELGCLIHSLKKGKQITDVFDQLCIQKVFSQITR